MTENGLFILGGPETQLHDILWAVHDGKNMVEVRARKISGSSRLRWEVGGHGTTAPTERYYRKGLRYYRSEEQYYRMPQISNTRSPSFCGEDNRG